MTKTNGAEAPTTPTDAAPPAAGAPPPAPEAPAAHAPEPEAAEVSYSVCILGADLSAEFLTETDPETGETDVALYDTVEEARQAGLKAGGSATVGSRVLVQEVRGAYSVGLVDLDTGEVVEV